MTMTPKLKGKEAEIVKATVEGRSTRDIALQHNVSHQTVWNAQNNLRELVREAAAKGELNTIAGLQMVFTGLLDHALRIIEEDSGDPKTVVAAIKAALDTACRIGDFAGLAPSKANAVTLNLAVNTLVQQIAPTEDELRTIVEMRGFLALPKSEQARRLRADADAMEMEGDGDE